jgi:CDP-paratose 2-epimerase
MAAGQSGIRHILVTGGAGFIGCNLVARLLEDPAARVMIFDDLSRPGVEHNLIWLQSLPGRGRLQFTRGDVRQPAEVYEATRPVDEIYHLAAQVAVTTSIDNPRSDFEVNAAGTMNVLEGARQNARRPMVFFTSTNKVYGGLESVAVHQHGRTYRADNAQFRGASESTPLDFHSPYGCSKGAADQYVRDYARIYNLPTIVFRMSCIAGPRQFGNEDQGWVAHFLYSVLAGKSITIFGNGCQVRDILHVDDLVDAILAARARLNTTAGETYNVGGGMKQSASVLEMLALVEQLTGVSARCTYAGMRPGDQPLYISDISKIEAHTGWRPRRSLEETMADIYRFWRGHRELILELTSDTRALRELPLRREYAAGEVA